MKLKDACSLEGKLWQNLESVLTQRHHFADKGPYSQSYGLPVVMWDVRCEIYGCENWTIKKAERQRTDAILLWC